MLGCMQVFNTQRLWSDAENLREFLTRSSRGEMVMDLRPYLLCPILHR